MCCKLCTCVCVPLTIPIIKAFTSLIYVDVYTVRGSGGQVGWSTKIYTWSEDFLNKDRPKLSWAILNGLCLKRRFPKLRASVCMKNGNKCNCTIQIIVIAKAFCGYKEFSPQNLHFVMEIHGNFQFVMKSYYLCALCYLAAMADEMKLSSDAVGMLNWALEPSSSLQVPM